MSASSILKNSAVVAAGSLAAGVGYASLIERNAFAVREVTMPVLSPGSSPLKVLHISDIHMRPQQRRKQAWLRELARLQPDFVVNTGDNLSHPKAVPAVVQSLGDLLSVPGVFVFGSNDYFGPRPKNPMNYLTNPGHRIHGEPLPWQDLRAAFTERGWLDMTHTRREFEVSGLLIAAAGVDDPHLTRDRYETIAGAASPAVNLRLGLTHSPSRGYWTASPPTAISWSWPAIRTAANCACPSTAPLSPTAAWTGRGPRARLNGAPGCSCTFPRASARRRTHPCGSAAGPRPPC